MMKPIIDFNYISKDLSDDDCTMLKRLYRTYHLKAWCYKKMYKSYKYKDLFIAIASTGLMVAGGAGGILNPIILTITGVGLIIQVLAKKKKYAKKIEHCRIAYICYQKQINALKGYMRGEPFDRNLLLFELNRLDDSMAELCPPLSDSVRNKYSSTYRVMIEPTFKMHTFDDAPQAGGIKETVI